MVLVECYKAYGGITKRRLFLQCYSFYKYQQLTLKRHGTDQNNYVGIIYSQKKMALDYTHNTSMQRHRIDCFC